MNYSKFKYYFKLLLGKHPFIFPNFKMEVERFGSSYGGWEVVKNTIKSDSIIYSIGIGNDISFDEALIENIGCNIHAYDPTPQVKDWIYSKARSPKFHFNAIGLGSSNSYIDIYSPENPKHISHSISPSSKNKNPESIKIPVKKLSSLMEENNHNYLDLIKMDIEGFEYSVIENIVSENVNIKQLLVEYHHGIYNFKNKDTKKSVKLLISKGYNLVNISDSGREYTFLNSKLI